MRRAAIADCWRKLGSVVDACNGIKQIEQNDIRSQVISTDGIFAVVGGNGAGKSSFFEFLTDSNYSKIGFEDHKISLHDNSVLYLPGDVINAILIDPYSEYKNIYNLLENFRSTFGQGGMSEINKDELELLNYVLSTNYETVQIEEIQVDDDMVCPRFIVTYDGVSYDNAFLSLGEQLVLYLFWLLTRKFNRPGIFFIEEPESGLSPIAQTRFLDLLAYISTKKAKQFFIATHSPFIVSKLGKDRVILMKKEAVSRWSKVSHTNYLTELGMEIGKKGIIFVEDNKARVFLRYVLGIYGSSLLKTFEIIFLNGESDVIEVVSRIGDRSAGFEILGILDGDLRETFDPRQYDGKFLFLPGDQPPERMMILAIRNEPHVFARQIGVAPQKVADSLRRLIGTDDHDFFEELSREIDGESSTRLFESALHVWFMALTDKTDIYNLISSLDGDLSNEDLSLTDECRMANT